MQKIYLPGLNGLRAIAAFAVIISHISLGLDKFGLQRAKGYDLANFGVTVFFTLSGFLITYLLLKEKEEKSKIAIKKFYMRRILRIWPLYFLYILLVLIFIGFKINNGIFFYLFIFPNVAFVLNIIYSNSFFIPYMTHYWSLGVEEQFYLFWPVTMNRVKNYSLFFVSFIFLFLLLKVVISVFKLSEFLNIFLHYTRFGCMAIGAFGAYLYYRKDRSIAFFNQKTVEISAWILLTIVGLNKFHIFSIIDHEIIALVTLIIIMNQVNNEKRIINLENKIFDYLGKISFGLYIYNPLIIAFLAKYSFDVLNVDDFYLRYLLVYLECFIIIILISHISYFYFEKTFLTLKEKFSTIKSVSSRKERDL